MSYCTLCECCRTANGELNTTNTRIAELEARLAGCEIGEDIARQERADAQAEVKRWKKAQANAVALMDHEEARADKAEAEVARRGEGVECHAARPGEGTYECSVHDGHKGCPACRLRMAEAEVARLEGECSVRLGVQQGLGRELNKQTDRADRLQAALERIRDHPPQLNSRTWLDMKEIAQAALTPPPAEPSDD